MPFEREQKEVGIKRVAHRTFPSHGKEKENACDERPCYVALSVKESAKFV